LTDYLRCLVRPVRIHISLDSFCAEFRKLGIDLLKLLLLLLRLLTNLVRLESRFAKIREILCNALAFRLQAVLALVQRNAAVDEPSTARCLIIPSAALPSTVSNVLRVTCQLITPTNPKKPIKPPRNAMNFVFVSIM
jgi:hypothetical protein